MSNEDRWWRDIRWAAYGCLALTVLQVIALPWPFGNAERSLAALPQWIGQIAFSLAFAVALFYRQRWAAALLGVYGLTRFYVIGTSAIHILDGSAYAIRLGPEVYLPVLIPLPFSVLWVRAGWSAVRLWRLPRDVVAQAI